MVQNALYAEALEEGRKAARPLDDPVDAVLAIVEPIIHCNRTQVENGRTYLREMVFGDPAEPHHAEALVIVEETEQAMTETIARTSDSAVEPAVLARIISSILFVAMAASPAGTSTESIRADVHRQVATLLAPRSA
jgi:hypothetical protein